MIRLVIIIFRFFFRIFPLLILYIAIYRDPARIRLRKAGIREKDRICGDVRFHYAESSDTDKPPLLLLHGHMRDWLSFQRVIVPLSEKYHVFALDLPGHGQTKYPDDYELSASSIAASLSLFIEEVIGRPVYICAHSTGGLAAVRLASERPDLIRALILEDVPLLTGEYPALRNTAAYEIFALCREAAEKDNEGDFPLYALSHLRLFVPHEPFPGYRIYLYVLIRLAKMLHGQGVLEIPFVSVSMRELLRGMDLYDTRFGKAFFDGTWNEGFDHAHALTKISCPVLLMQSEAVYSEDGTLLSAMSDEAVSFVLSRLNHGTYLKIPAGDITHLRDPQTFVTAVSEFLH